MKMEMRPLVTPGCYAMTSEVYDRGKLLAMVSVLYIFFPIECRNILESV